MQSPGIAGCWARCHLLRGSGQTHRDGRHRAYLPGRGLGARTPRRPHGSGLLLWAVVGWPLPLTRPPLGLISEASPRKHPSLQAVCRAHRRPPNRQSPGHSSLQAVVPLTIRAGCSLPSQVLRPKGPKSVALVTHPGAPPAAGHPSLQPHVSDTDKSAGPAQAPQGGCPWGCAASWRVKGRADAVGG